jgi:hypothetical protein
VKIRFGGGGVLKAINPREVTIFSEIVLLEIPSGIVQVKQQIIVILYAPSMAFLVYQGGASYR